MPQHQQGVLVLWRWCAKNNIWSIRTCGHSKCSRLAITRRAESRPTDTPA